MTSEGNGAGQRQQQVHRHPVDCHPGLAKPSPGSRKRRRLRLQPPQGLLGLGSPLRCVRDDKREAAAQDRGSNKSIDILSIVIPDWQSQVRDPGNANACGTSHHRGYWVPDLRSAASGKTSERQRRRTEAATSPSTSCRLSSRIGKPSPGSRKRLRLQPPQGVLGPRSPLRCVRDDEGEVD